MKMKKLIKSLPWVAIMLFCILGMLFSCKTTETVSRSESKNPFGDRILHIGQKVSEQSVTVSEPKVAFVKKLQAELKKGSVDKALALFNDLPESLAKDPQIMMLHASLLVSSNHLDEAQSIADELLRANPKNTDALLIKVMVAKKKGDTAAKTKLLSTIIAIDPKNSDANVELANDQMLRKKYKLAGKYYSTAIEGNPNNTTAIIGYGQCAYYQGNIDEAKKAFDRVLSIDPKNSMAYSFLAKLDVENENYGSATANMKKAIELDGNYPDYWIDYGRYLHDQGKNKEAEDAWNRAIKLDENNLLVYIYRSGLYDEQNRFSEAIADYKKIISIKPEYGYAYESLGILYWHEKNWAESRENFLKAGKFNPNNISYPLMVSATYMKEKKSSENKKYLSNVLKNRDQSSLEYLMLRLFHDEGGFQNVEAKVRTETNTVMHGKCNFYLALFSDLHDDDVNAKKYYTEVAKMEAPMFFEYRIAEWALGKK